MLSSRNDYDFVSIAATCDFVRGIIGRKAILSPQHDVEEFAAQAKMEISFVQMERRSLIQPAAAKNVEYLGRSPACSGKFPVDLHVSFTFQPVEPNILTKWEAP